ncbi:glycosyltransferase [Flavobacterium sp. MAH-1]|uniref:Glycosyltransferase n=1 Tax=Flavobacterium agri TaxID=2743471 RepID=A0A7Y8Y1K6_9FLAO|nr:glycosyltransferase [Flavobacterium agri]NUY80877.1 glycosyltransferase [Flavobacterium agri]NYA70901.1 glycosyltransferase [Flavobacterium agri]
MRLLYIINSLGTGGAEKLIADMLPLVKEQGFDVELLLLRKVDSLFIKPIEDAGIKIHYSPFGLYSFKNIGFIKKLSKDFDLVHVHLFPAQYLASVVFGKTPMIVTEHCTTNKRRSKAYYRPIEKFSYGRYKKIVSISSKADDSLKKWLGFPKDKFAVIENGINLETFYNAKPKAIPEVPADAKKIIMVGRFNATKDHPTAIKAMTLLPNDIHLLLVGEGNLKQDCIALAQTLKVDHKVHFLGLRSDVAELLKSCDINLISSHSEGLSISSLECLASGKPLITSNVNGLREINQNAGLMFEDNNHEQLADCVTQLLGDKTFYDQVVERCLERVKQYDIRKTVAEHIAVYNQILAK